MPYQGRFCSPVKTLGEDGGTQLKVLTQRIPTDSGRFLITLHVEVLIRLCKQRVCILHIANGQKPNHFCIVLSTANRKVAWKWVTCDVTLFSCSCKTKKQAHMLHTPSLKEIPEQIHPLCLHPFLSCWYLAGHVYCHYIPLSWFTESWGTVTDLSSMQNKRTTGNFAFEGLIMHERLKWVRARGMLLCDPLFNPNIHEQTHPLPSE